MRRAVIGILVLLILGTILPHIQSAEEKIILNYEPKENPTISEGENITFRVVVKGGISVVWYLDGKSVQWGNSTYIFKANYSSSGIHNITVIAKSPTKNESISWTLKVLNIYQPPRIISTEPSTDFEIKSDEEAHLSITLENLGNETITYQWFINGEYMLSSNSSSFIYVPKSNFHGNIRIEVRCTDGITVMTHVWNLTVNLAYAVFPEGDVIVEEGEEITFILKNAKNGTCVWYLDGYPIAGEINGTYTFRTSKNVGEHNLTVTTEGFRYSWKIKVIRVNKPPVLPTGAEYEVYVGEEIKIKVNAKDDGKIVSYEWDLDNDGTYDKTTDTGILRHKFESPGEHIIKLRVTDDDGASSEAMFVYDVKEKKSAFNWWIPAGIIFTICVIILILIIIQQMKITDLEKKTFFIKEDEEKKDEEFKVGDEEIVEEPKRETIPEFPSEEHAVAATPAEAVPTEEEIKEDVELGEVPAVTAEPAASPEVEVTEAKVTEAETEEKEEEKVEKKESPLEDIISSLLDREAESEVKAGDTELEELTLDDILKEKKDEKKDEKDAQALSDRGVETEAEPSEVDLEDVLKKLKKE